MRKTKRIVVGVAHGVWFAVVEKLDGGIERIIGAKQHAHEAMDRALAHAARHPGRYYVETSPQELSFS